tara:strand:+ start:1322 stop:1702 length:381 start_codon:yes stop_codon:yes gene_type:complete
MDRLINIFKLYQKEKFTDVLDEEDDDNLSDTSDEETTSLFSIESPFLWVMVVLIVIIIIVGLIALYRTMSDNTINTQQYQPRYDSVTGQPLSNPQNMSTPPINVTVSPQQPQQPQPRSYGGKKSKK